VFAGHVADCSKFAGDIAVGSRLSVRLYSATLVELAVGRLVRTEKTIWKQGDQ